MRAASISAVAFGAGICGTRFIDPRRPVNGIEEKWHQNAATIGKSSLSGSPLFAIPEPIGVKVVYFPNCCSRYLMIYKAQRDCVCMLPWQINKILITGTRCLPIPQDAAFCAVTVDESLATASGGSFARGEFNRTGSDLSGGESRPLRLRTQFCPALPKMKFITRQ